MQGCLQIKMVHLVRLIDRRWHHLMGEPKDESSYTAFNLPDSEQSFQGAKAIAIDDDKAARLIRKHFPDKCLAHIRQPFQYSSVNNR